MKYLLILLLFISKSVLAESYNCAGELSQFKKNKEVETKIYKRNGNTFNYIGKTYTGVFYIIKETNSVITLANSIDDNIIWITFINKLNETFSETVVYGSEQPSPALIGICLKDGS